MIRAGIDYSMTSPAICLKDDSDGIIKLFSLNSGAKKFNGTHKFGDIVIQIDQMESDWQSPMDRYNRISDWAINILKTHNVEEVSIEGYSMGSSSGMVFNIAENAGLLKYKMFINSIPFNAPSPTQVKKAFTGMGNAKKNLMCDKFFEINGFRPSAIYGGKQYGSPENDLVDAFAIMQFAGEKLD